MSKASICTEGRTVPGELMRMVGDGLTGHGLHVEYPDHPDSRDLTITSVPSALQCRLSVQDTGDIQCEYLSTDNGNPNPMRVTDIVTALLTGKAGPHEWLGRGNAVKGITFKGIVGLELKARGFGVELEIIRDEDFFDVASEIVVTGTYAGEQSRVIVNDQGAVTWINDYWPDYAVIKWQPKFSGWLGEKGTIARDIIETVRRAVSV